MTRKIAINISDRPKYSRKAGNPAMEATKSGMALLPHLHEVVRHEAAGVAGDRRGIFAYADARRLLADDPRSYGGVAVPEFGDGRVRLIDVAFGAIATLFSDHLTAAIDGDVPAFARQQRLLHVVAGNFVALEKRRQQIG